MKSSKSSLFLMEMIISILFFSVAAAACIQLFVKAHLIDNQTKEQNQAVIWSQNLAELWYASDGNLCSVYEQLCIDYPDAASGKAIYLTPDTDNNLSLYFTKDWELCGLDNSAFIVYHIELPMPDFEEETMLYTTEISFYKGEEAFYQLPLSLHIPTERSDVQ